MYAYCGKTWRMKRTAVFLPEQMLKELRAKMKETGLSMADLIRRAIEFYLQRKP